MANPQTPERPESAPPPEPVAIDPATVGEAAEDPGADTAMFRKFVADGEEPSSAAKTRAALIAGAAVLLVLIIVMVLLLQQ